MNVFYLIIPLLFLYIAFRLLRFVFSSKKVNQFGFTGKLVYADQGQRSRLFINKFFLISAKPDFIYKIGFRKYEVVEYKSRMGKVYESDIVQTKASVIAARSKFNVRKALICTKGETLEIDVDKSSAEIYKEIKKETELARKIKSKVYVAECTKDKYKCNSCSMRKHCQV